MAYNLTAIHKEIVEQ